MRVLDTLVKARGVLQKSQRHICVDCRLMLDQYDDFIVDETGDVVAKSHVHYLLKAERFELRRCIE